jgi:hypothetical protein
VIREVRELVANNCKIPEGVEIRQREGGGMREILDVGDGNGQGRVRREWSR